MKYQKVIETNKELMPKGEKSGDISYDHQRLEQLDDLRSIKEIAYLFQNPLAQMVMDTVWHEIAFGLENTGMLYEQMSVRLRRSLIILICKRFIIKVQMNCLEAKNRW